METIGNLSIAANIGGTAGLFLGASILTIMEVWDFLLITFGLVAKTFATAGQVQQSPKASREDLPKSTRGNSFGMSNSVFDVNKDDAQQPK